MKCAKCGKSLQQLMLLAMLQDLGARVSPKASKKCAAGGEHEFEEEAPDALDERKP